jgi:hypothetical protein
LLTPWVLDIPKDYLDWVNEKEPEEVLSTLRYSVNKGKPLGTEIWTDGMIDTFKLTATLRASGRPKKGS